MRTPKKPTLALYLALVVAYAGSDLGINWFMHHALTYANWRDALTSGFFFAAVTWSFAFYRWYKYENT
jgi:hypothetical protein